MSSSLLRSIGFFLSIPLAAGSAWSGGGALTVTETVNVAASPAKTFDAVKDFDGLHKWHPVIASTQITKGHGNAKGTVRVLTTKDGAKITEELLSHSDSTMAFEYRITDSPLPISDYVSTLKVTKSGTGSTVTWSSTFKAKDGTPDEDAKKLISGVLRAGLDNLGNVLK